MLELLQMIICIDDHCRCENCFMGSDFIHAIERQFRKVANNENNILEQ